VPILGGNEIIAAKAHGELYRFEVDPLWGTLSMHHKYRFADPIDDDSDPTFPPRYRIRPEQSPVIGRYPYDPTNYELLVALDDTVEDKTKYLILDVDAWTVGSSMVDPTGFVELETVHRAAGWGPAAAARSFLSDIGPIYDGLTFVVAVGADVPTVGTSVQCPPSAEDGTPTWCTTSSGCHRCATKSRAAAPSPSSTSLSRWCPGWWSRGRWCMSPPLTGCSGSTTRATRTR
jgi:hypothetical protein